MKRRFDYSILISYVLVGHAVDFKLSLMLCFFFTTPYLHYRLFLKKVVFNDYL